MVGYWLQRLKGRGLRWLRVERKAGLAEESVDEVGPALDGAVLEGVDATIGDGAVATGGAMMASVTRPKINLPALVCNTLVTLNSTSCPMRLRL